MSDVVDIPDTLSKSQLDLQLAALPRHDFAVHISKALAEVILSSSDLSFLKTHCKAFDKTARGHHDSKVL